ncbi:hypothetical protein [Mycobacteroides abscessus]|uniref:hypothetical protein n=1 Tax=Mycobacteroides abscessus TaxID=36809 RepID=UPI0013000837|nr:hypothetical protein [Mycobacteroides abscessus]
MTSSADGELLPVNPAYSSIWGSQHWQRSTQSSSVARVAATVIGRRSMPIGPDVGKGVTPQRPENR